ncbi:hypothetical protein [Pseudoduganella ginsengisoli]|uniref:hypothetical protein n=1 Tax=Pseudoduganella ginsengisoli TaxID=1462440 RepID=UPI003530DD38
MSRIPSSFTSLPFPDQLRWLRRHQCENQTAFWSRFGVTQPQGSRYEQGCDIPEPVVLLLRLYIGMHISDRDLLAVGALIRNVHSCQLPALRVVERCAHL